MRKGRAGGKLKLASVRIKQRTVELAVDVEPMEAKSDRITRRRQYEYRNRRSPSLIYKRQMAQHSNCFAVKVKE